MSHPGNMAKEKEELQQVQEQVEEQKASYKNITVKGIVSVQPSSREEIGYYDMTLILMGPTGSGKSAFIEALASGAPEGPLGISKNQLDSVTQDITFYEIINVTKSAKDSKIRIVDTPGFADPKISELNVLSKLRDLRERGDYRGYVRVLYFHPITDIRLPGSRRKCLDIIQSFWGARNAPRLYLCTTMWDQLGKGVERYADRFHDLESNHWGDWNEAGSRVFKFENTLDSALAILDNASGMAMPNESFPRVKDYGEGAVSNVIHAPVVEVLQDRIERLHQLIESIDQDLSHPETRSNGELVSLLALQRDDLNGDLAMFNDEMNGILSPYATTPTASPLSSPPVDQTAFDGSDDDPQGAAAPRKRSILASAKQWMHRQRESSFKLGIRKP